METFSKNKQLPVEGSENNRRTFLKKGVLLGTLTGVTGLGLVTACKEEGEPEVSPPEDLMREHGVLSRILLIYDTCKLHLANNEQFDMVILKNSAEIIRTFIGDYHEKLEEDFLFPRFVNANQLVPLVQTLYIQHSTGKKITDQILQLVTPVSLKNAEDTQKLIRLLHDFNRMYHPHKAWEDTILFPALRKIVSKNEYFALGEEFEDREHEFFGEDGFGTIVEKVANIEKQLGIYELSEFTPQL